MSIVLAALLAWAPKARAETTAPRFGDGSFTTALGTPSRRGAIPIPELREPQLLTEALAAIELAISLPATRGSDPHAGSVVAVVVQDEGGKTLRSGAGVIVGDGEIVTTWHLLGGRARVTVVPRLEDPSRSSAFACTASVERMDEVSDLAILRVKGLPGPASAVELREAPLVEGDSVRVIGPTTGWAAVEGLVVALEAEHGWRARPEYPAHTAAVAGVELPEDPGVPGAPVFDGQGRLAGILAYHGGKELYYAVTAAHVAQVRRLERSRRGRWPKTAVDREVADRNGDGRPDMAKVDTDRNGKFDRVYLDRDFDGRLDTVYLDRDEDGREEGIGYDADGDGGIETYDLDGDEDGTPEGRGYDHDQDGEVDVVRGV